MTSDADAPWIELTDLPGFNLELRAKMEAILYYSAPALNIDDAGWRGLGQILARYERDAQEAKAIEGATGGLQARNRKDIDATVLRPLRKAQHSLKTLLRNPAIRERVERVSGDGTVVHQLAEVIRALEEAIRMHERPAPLFLNDDTGRLEGSLRLWWDRRARAKSGGGRGATAYNQFLGLCYSVLSKPPGHRYDALKAQRATVAHNAQVWTRLADKLKRFVTNR